MIACDVLPVVMFMQTHEHELKSNPWLQSFLGFYCTASCVCKQAYSQQAASVVSCEAGSSKRSLAHPSTAAALISQKFFAGLLMKVFTTSPTKLNLENVKF